VTCRADQETLEMRLALLASLVVCLAAGQSTARTAHAPSQAAQSSVVLTGDLGPVGEGRRNFLKWNCYGCHGMNAAGGMGPNIQGKGTADVLDAMRFGHDQGMPSFVQIATVADMNNVAAYLQSIGTPGEPTWVDWWVANPTK
jgi:cytochrome c551